MKPSSLISDDEARWFLNGNININGYPRNTWKYPFAPNKLHSNISRGGGKGDGPINSSNDPSFAYFADH